LGVRYPIKVSYNYNPLEWAGNKLWLNHRS
jgi:hypothetical protein